MVQSRADPGSRHEHDPEELPPVPVSALASSLFCPRQFYLDWVDRHHVDSDALADGRWHHRVVDEPVGHVPEPATASGSWRATSVSLSSPVRGLVTRIDVLEGNGADVIPVEYKSGTGPVDGDTVAAAIAAQVCAQGLVLVDNGYRCSEGAVYFTGSRRRHRIPFDEELMGSTRQALATLRATAAAPSAPPPLVDDPRCGSCSVVGICLPDETNTLAERSQPSRRLLARDPDAAPLYVAEHGAKVGHRAGRILVTKSGEELASVRLIDVSQICVYGNAQVTTQLLRAVFAKDIPVCWFTYGGWFSGIGHGMPAKNVELRRRQAVAATSGDLTFARDIVAAKIRNSRVLLRRNTDPSPTAAIQQLDGLADAAGRASSIPTLLGIEGTAARVYFAHFGEMLSNDGDMGTDFEFSNRNRRPPTDRTNCLLSFVYALLVKDITATTFGVGLDPYLGFLHRPRFGRPALSLDLMEELRSVVCDSTVIRLVNNGEVSSRDFVIRSGAVALTDAGRKKVIAGYERRMAIEITHPLFGYRVSYRRLLDLQARVLASYLLGEIDRYSPLLVR